ncbi:MAG: hypothetical protein HY402_06290 [Elusimicrobia bacterium]|nr:hypothetical protein [Elusimicrobiota bacterium]
MALQAELMARLTSILNEWIHDIEEARCLFYQTWGQNLIVSLSDAERRRWIGVLGKHGPHFPIFGSSFENILLYCPQERLAYGLIQEQIPELSLHFRERSLRAEFTGRLVTYTPQPQGSDPGTSCQLRLAFSTKPMGKQKKFLKRLLPGNSRFVPGAAFDNQWLSGATQENWILLGRQRLSFQPQLSYGHLENSRWSLLTPRHWHAPFHYLGLLGPSLSFHYEWNLLPWTGKHPLEKAISKIKSKIREKKTFSANPAAAPAPFAGLRVPAGEPEAPSVPAPMPHPQWNIQEPQILLTFPWNLGGYIFKRQLVSRRDAENQVWYGIQETFEHPTLPH